MAVQEFPCEGVFGRRVSSMVVTESRTVASGLPRLQCARPNLLFYLSLCCAGQMSDLLYPSCGCQASIQGEILYPPPLPPCLAIGICSGMGVGVHILVAPAAEIVYAPLFYTPPTPRRAFSG